MYPLKKNIYLQIYTSGFKAKIDQAYAIAYLETSQDQSKDAITILGIDQAKNIPNILESLCQKWDKDTVIHMFNGRREWELASGKNKDLRRFYHKKVKDLFIEGKKYKYFIKSKNMSLEEMSLLGGYKDNTRLGPDIYTDYYPFKREEDKQGLFIQAEKNLYALKTIHQFLDQVGESLVYKGLERSILLEKVIKEKSSLIVEGQVSPPHMAFAHQENLIFESQDRGTFTLKLNIIDTKYDEDKTCWALPYGIPLENPLPIPEGYILLAIDEILYPNQIFQIINSLLI